MAVAGPEGSRRWLYYYYYYYYYSRFGLPLTGWLRIAGRNGGLPRGRVVVPKTRAIVVIASY